MVVVLVRFIIRNPGDKGLLLRDLSLFGIVDTLIHSDVCLVDEHTVGRNEISLLNINDVTDNKLPDSDRLDGSRVAPVHQHSGLVDLISDLV